MKQRTAIGCWFVADTAETGTFFPQIGARSDAPSSQATYWRCVVDFYASSIAVNTAADHILFTNISLPWVDGIDIADALGRWGVQIVELPITYRLPPKAVSEWGNQFYIFDIMDWLSQRVDVARAIILDSDCLWLKPVDEMERAIDAEGALTYILDEPADQPINGLSSVGMARFLEAAGGPAEAAIPYCGGEIVAARHKTIVRMMGDVHRLWPKILEQGADAPKEEAHFLSILYALQHLKMGTANEFIRRMWTTFKVHDLKDSDRDLTIWHVPAEKKTGFLDLFRDITRNPTAHPVQNRIEMGLSYENYASRMGFPRRRTAKFVRDITFKLGQKIRNAL